MLALGAVYPEDIDETVHRLQNRCVSGHVDDLRAEFVERLKGIECLALVALASARDKGRAVVEAALL